MALLDLNWIDFSIIGIIGISVLISLMRGFVREAISLLTWIIAFVVAFKFCGALANLFASFIQTPFLRLILSFALLFIIVLVLGALINFLMGELITHSGLGGADRFLGMLFGFLRGVLLAGVLILLVSITTLVNETYWQKSVLIPYFQVLVSWMRAFLPY